MRKTAFIAALLLVFTNFLISNLAKAQSKDRVEQNTTEQTTDQPKSNEPKMVEVQPGDSLVKIADANETTWPRLFNANEQIKHPDLIYPGDKLRVPLDEEQLPERQLYTPPPASVAKQQSVKTSRRHRISPTPATSIDGTVWDKLAACESGGNWGINTGNGYYGGLQFTPGSWRAAGGSGLPHQASREEQIVRGEALKSRQGWGAWPACSRKLGLR